MGIVHKATMSPTKQELIEAWLPTRGWADGMQIADKVAEYRLDDPAGEVGVETIVWRLEDGRLIQTPVTYRAAPLEGADAHLVGTCDHSTLGPRWVYHGCGDPVWADTLTTAILTGGVQSQMYFEENGTRTDIPARMQVRGSEAESTAPRVEKILEVVEDGTVTETRSSAGTLRFGHVVGEPLGDGPHLAGTIGDETTTLAVLQRAD